jgi:hypothetical protein
MLQDISSGTTELCFLYAPPHCTDNRVLRSLQTSCRRNDRMALLNCKERMPENKSKIKMREKYNHERNKPDLELGYGVVEETHQKQTKVFTASCSLTKYTLTSASSRDTRLLLIAASLKILCSFAVYPGGFEHELLESQTIPGRLSFKSPYTYSGITSGGRGGLDEERDKF